MKIKHLTKLGLLIVLVFSVGLPTVGAAETPVKISYVQWSTEVASSYLVKAIIQERLDRESVEELQRIGPDALTVAAYGQILPAEVLNVASLGAVNVHASLLPRYRGAAPIQWALLNGDSVTGVTTMRMEQGMDSGPILEQRALAIGVEDTAGTLRDELAQMGASLLLSTLTRLAAGNLVPVAQDPNQISYAPKLGKEVRHIDWNQSAQKIHNTIRALHPSPGAYCYLRKSADEALLRVRLFPGEPGEEVARAGPGEVLGRFGLVHLVHQVHQDPVHPVAVLDDLAPAAADLEPGDALLHFGSCHL